MAAKSKNREHKNQEIVDAVTVVKSMELSNDNGCSNTMVVDKNKQPKVTDVQRFYENKNVLITGATGFLGKVLMEKLLRCCPGVENLYILVRPKRGKDIYTRLEEIFEDPLFGRLRDEVPKFRHKIVVIAGDCEAAGLGLTISDRQMLTEKVNIIYHSAATVKFDEHLRTALATNVRASIYLLELAKEMRDLQVFMHVSTAFCIPFLNRVEEKLYPFDVDYEKLQDTVEKLSDEQINIILPKVLGKWPNTYTFTKAMTEKELAKRAGNVPLCIFRPAIVSSTAKEPLKCWVDNVYGPTGVAVGCVTGILRTMQCDENVTADLVPVDYLINCLLVSSAHVNSEYSQRSQPREPHVFNYVSSVENRLTWKDFNRLNVARIDDVPFSNAVWYIATVFTKYAFLHKIYSVFLHLLPAAVMDALSICIGRKPKMLKVNRKIEKFLSVLSYFSTREYLFCNRRTRELWDQTSNADRQLFPFSVSEIDWNDYFQDYLLGIRRYFFKEADDTLPQARRKWRRLYYLHVILRLCVFVFFIYAMWYLMSRLL